MKNLLFNLFIYIEIYVDSVFQCYAKPSINYLTPSHEMSSPRTQINKDFKNSIILVAFQGSLQLKQIGDTFPMWVTYFYVSDNKSTLLVAIKRCYVWAAVLRELKMCHQYLRSVTNISKLSATSILRHHFFFQKLIIKRPTLFFILLFKTRILIILRKFFQFMVSQN